MPRLLTQDDKRHLVMSVWSAVSDQSLPASWHAASIESENHEKLLIADFALAGVLARGGDHLERAYTYVRHGYTAADCIEPAQGTINQHPIMKHFSQFLEVVARELSACGKVTGLALADIKLVFVGTCLPLFHSVLQRDLLEFSIDDPEALLLEIYDELISINGTININTGLPHAYSKLAFLLKSVVRSGMAGR